LYVYLMGDRMEAWNIPQMNLVCKEPNEIQYHILAQLGFGFSIVLSLRDSLFGHFFGHHNSIRIGVK